MMYMMILFDFLGCLECLGAVSVISLNWLRFVQRFAIKTHPEAIKMIPLMPFGVSLSLFKSDIGSSESRTLSLRGILRVTTLSSFNILIVNIGRDQYLISG